MPRQYNNPIDIKLRKRVTWFSLTFVFLVVVALLFEGPWSGKRKTRPKEATLLVADTSNLSEIFIKDTKDSVELKNVQGSWMVFKPGENVGYKADPDQIRRSLAHLEDIGGEVVSTKQEKYAVFEVADTQALYIRVKDKKGKVLGELYIGKTGPDFSSTYVRAKGRDEVILTDGFLKSYFYTDFNRWRNRKIISFKPSTAVKFALYKENGDSLVITKTDTGWVFADGGKADSIKVNETLRYLGNLRALGFGDTLSPEVTGLQNPPYTVRATLNDGSVYTLYIGNKIEKPERYVVMTEGDNTVYLVSTYGIKKFIRNKKEYIPKPKEEKKAEKNQEKKKKPTKK